MEQFDENMDWNGYMEGGQWDDNDYAHGLDPRYVFIKEEETNLLNRIWESDSDLEQSQQDDDYMQNSHNQSQDYFFYEMFVVITKKLYILFEHNFVVIQ